MTDLTNRTAKEVNEFIQIYAPLLEISGIKNVLDAQLLAIVLDVTIKYIKEKHNDLSVDWKSWSAFVVKKEFQQKKIKTEEDIQKIIDDFVKFYKKNYKEYCDNLGSNANEYDKDRGFVYRFLR